MKASYSIHAGQGYVEIRIEGSVTAASMLGHIETVWSDPAWSPTYNGLIDFAAATLDMTDAEVEGLAKGMAADPRCSLGRWGFVVSTAATFAKLRHVNRVADDLATLRIFFDLGSAKDWLLTRRQPGPLDAAKLR